MLGRQRIHLTVKILYVFSCQGLLRRKGFLLPLGVRPRDEALGDAQRHFYGNLGTLLKRNVVAEWWYSIVTSRKTIAYCISEGNPLKVLDNIDAISDTEEKDMNSGVNIAHAGTLSHQDDVVRSVFGELRVTGLLSLSLHVFCPESRQKTLAQEWERVRLQWWKKYSHRNKSHFLVEKTDDRTRLIQHTCSLGKYSVEKLTQKDNKEMRSLLSERPLSNKLDGLGCISMETSADQALLTFLTDSYEETSRFDTSGQPVDQQILFLHPRLSPYQAVILPVGDDQSNAHKLAGKLELDLRQAGVSVTSDVDGDVGSRFIRQDETGTPYAILVDETTVRKGLTRFRSRDTTQSELVELDDVKAMLRHYHKRR
ncbi:DNA polymerase subunit gamma-2, mitochondrial-like isoform X2 [Oscarella lobularis]|uniref:DNA polymerase subunit gamma-2, mitochondrial-like isoform X2 n=1 Tax=Oscarella lobularis TaxID=121494 RepID=UPI00331349C4